jgi:hypothetical protein
MNPLTSDQTIEKAVGFMGNIETAVNQLCPSCRMILKRALKGEIK